MFNFESYFSVQIFFIILRETLESAIIVSVLLAFLKQNFTSTNPTTQQEILLIDSKEYRSLKLQIWFGGLLGLFICLLIGGTFVGVFYILGNDLWSLAERLWEGIFSILSSIIISFMGIALLRINQMQYKWHFKLTQSLEMQREHGQKKARAHDINTGVIGSAMRRFKTLSTKYFLAILPLVTTLREGLEAVVFIAGIGVNQPMSSFPLAILCGAGLGFTVGWLLYKGGNRLSLQYFLIFSTCFLYLVSAGLMSRGVWFFELEKYVRDCHGQDMSEVGSGPGSYDIAKSVWHVNCCNGLKDGGWMLFNALLGWTNSATYGSVISYNLYWVGVIVLLRLKLYEERNGYMPGVPIKWQLKKIRKRLAILQATTGEVTPANSVNDMTPVNSAGETVPQSSETEGLLTH
ncbi:hypothetical protein BABINDRAFT_161462 [Babjeviella inositovora NRRL Y-12698]|uniref:Iron permease FTR1 n=1 Tax=Babjeviella inositovora NRRL Y-12698 TaxID=984486 RepID=A0A1E3QRU8_9ASCO|nr:uncharacterized protein BABINDRAFT_161462 [Babjeviella inositovora NRRL Y-12698]ODQ79762.1 hypothetical protein BABINDRAFT_161462 [Babjeviella inositovora NRRL Y-12698]